MAKSRKSTSSGTHSRTGDVTEVGGAGRGAEGVGAGSAGAGLGSGDGGAGGGLRGVVVAAGLSGLIGQELQGELVDNGWGLVLLQRDSQARGHELAPRPCPANPIVHVSWNPDEGVLNPQLLAGADAIICLNGAPIARWPWTRDYRRKLVASRIKSVGTIVGALSVVDPSERPSTFLCASAIGYYGDRGERKLAEDAASGHDFLATLCRRWEEAAQEAPVKQVVNLRTGLVITPQGGLLAKLLPLFKAGLGGRLGDGRQWQAPIALADHVRAVEFILDIVTAAHSGTTPAGGSAGSSGGAGAGGSAGARSGAGAGGSGAGGSGSGVSASDAQRVAAAAEILTGPVNLCCPNPLRNADFTRELAQYCGRRVGPPVPAPVLQLAAGAMASLALSSQRVVPQKLLDAGFVFRYPEFADQLRANDSGDE